MLVSFLSEFVGTFIFLLVILKTKGNAIAIGVVLAGLVYAFSGIQVNPAISLVLYANESIDITTLGINVCAQVLGGLCALFWTKKIEPTV